MVQRAALPPYLSPFDHFVKRERRCPGYVRFVDDLLFFGDDKGQLWDWKGGAVERLARMRLTIHPGAHPRPVGEGFPFLGFVVYPTHRRLKSRQVAAYWRRWRALLAGYVSGEETRDAVVASLLGWINHARYGDTWGLRRAVAGQVTFQSPMGLKRLVEALLAEPMVIFTRTYDFLTWLIPQTLNFPRSQRFVVTRRLQDAALDFQEHIIEANRLWGRERLARLRQADADLDKVRLYLRLAMRWEWLNEGQYHHVSAMVKEIGEMLGGWIKQTVGTKG